MKFCTVVHHGMKILHNTFNFLSTFNAATLYLGLPWWLSSKEFTCQCWRRRCRLDPRSGRSLKEELATHPSILAWEIPWAEEPGGLQSMGSQRVGYNLTTGQHLWNNKSVFAKIHGPKICRIIKEWYFLNDHLSKMFCNTVRKCFWVTLKSIRLT